MSRTETDTPLSLKIGEPSMSGYLVRELRLPGGKRMTYVDPTMQGEPLFPPKDRGQNITKRTGGKLERF